MILKLYIDGEFKKKMTYHYSEVNNSFDDAVFYLRQQYGLKNKKWYILIFNNKERFQKLYCPVPENMPKYITVPSIFPEILE